MYFLGEQEDNKVPALRRESLKRMIGVSGQNRALIPAQHSDLHCQRKELKMNDVKPIVFVVDDGRHTYSRLNDEGFFSLSLLNAFDV